MINKIVQYKVVWGGDRMLASC